MPLDPEIEKKIKRKAKRTRTTMKKVEAILVSIFDKHERTITSQKSLDMMAVVAMTNPFLKTEYGGDIDELRKAISSLFDFSIKVEAAGTPNPVVLQMKGMVEQSVMKYITNMGDDTKKQLGTIISEGIKKQQSHIDVAGQIQREIKISKGRAKTIARTETMRASELATYTQSLADGAQFFVVDNRAEACRTCKRTVAGKVFKIDEKQYIPPLHPNCACIALYYTDEQQAKGDSKSIKRENENTVKELEKKGLYLPPDGTGPLQEGAKGWKDPRGV